MAGLEIDQKFRIKGLILITGLEVQVWASAASGISTKADNLPCLDIFVGLYVQFGQVGIPSLQSVAVADNDQVSISSGVIFGIAYPSVENGIDRFSNAERNIYTIVASVSSRTIFGENFAHYRSMKLVEIIDQLKFGDSRQIVVFDVSISKDAGCVPMLGINIEGIQLLEIWTVIGPGVVTVKNDFGFWIAGSNGIQRPFGQLFQFG